MVKADRLPGWQQWTDTNPARIRGEIKLNWEHRNDSWGFMAWVGWEANGEKITNRKQQGGTALCYGPVQDRDPEGYGRKSRRTSNSSDPKGDQSSMGILSYWSSRVLAKTCQQTKDKLKRNLNFFNVQKSLTWVWLNIESLSRRA